MSSLCSPISPTTTHDPQLTTHVPRPTIHICLLSCNYRSHVNINTGNLPNVKWICSRKVNHSCYIREGERVYLHITGQHSTWKPSKRKINMFLQRRLVMLYQECIRVVSPNWNKFWMIYDGRKWLSFGWKKCDKTRNWWKWIQLEFIDKTWRGVNFSPLMNKFWKIQGKMKLRVSG